MANQGIINSTTYHYTGCITLPHRQEHPHFAELGNLFNNRWFSPGTSAVNFTDTANSSVSEQRRYGFVNCMPVKQLVVDENKLLHNS
ncbi:MAG: hypothetical protein H7Y31_01860 [Chitinophagaceae bacterium]|nr:hypothetical protein [Chitinophagaceae bacterium]